MPTDPSEQFQVGGDFTECLRLAVMHSPSGRFLTSEVFNNEVNVSGTAMRRRQVWSIVVERSRSDTVYLLGNLGRFLSADRDGKVNAASNVPGKDERFLLEYSPQATGEWAFRSEAHGFYLSGSDTQVSCFSKTPVWWSIRLAIHPQVHLLNLFRSSYLRLIPNAGELRADQTYPWGSDSCIWLEQPVMTATNGTGKPPDVGRSAVARLGRLALRCQSGHYLRADGSLSAEMDDSTLFSLELRSGSPRGFAFRDSTGAYLSATGRGTIKVKAGCSSAGKEDVFAIERAALQVGILAHNNKYASVKQGSEISANQQEMDETAIFQLEYIGGKGFNSGDAASVTQPLPWTPSGDGVSPRMKPGNGEASDEKLALNGAKSPYYFLATGLWRLRSYSGKLWCFSPSATVQIEASDDNPSSLFEVFVVAEENETVGPGQLVLRSSPPKGTTQTVAARKLGALSCSGRPAGQSEAPTVNDLFRLVLVNRPSVAFVSMLTGGFLCRGKQNALDCCGVACERLALRLTKHKSYLLFLGDRKTGISQLIARPDGLLQVKSTNLDPNHNLESIEPEAGTEFILYFIGNGRIVLRSLNGPIPGLALVKAEAKGDVKVDSVSEILTNHIWEI